MGIEKEAWVRVIADDQQRRKKVGMRIYVGGIYMGTYSSIEEYVQDAGYATIEQAAAALNQSVEDFLSDIEIAE